MFASAYFPNSYFPKSYFPECLVEGEVVVVPPSAGNWKPYRKRRVPTVRELLERERREARQKFDGVEPPELTAPSVYVSLSETTERLLREMQRLQPPQDADLLKTYLADYVRRLVLLGIL